MSPRPRIPTLSVASAAAIGLLATLGVAAPAHAEPCTGAAAAAQPPAAGNAEETPLLPGLNRRPVGQRPDGANDDAPLPSLGQISAPLQQQAGVRPRPDVPDAQTVNPPPAPPPPSPPGTSLVGWVTGPDSPNKTIERFAITGTDLGIMWDNGDPANRQVLMAFG
ncbi:hypothetical protein ABQF26_28470, partial [Mycolicibacterium elephantis]